MDLNRIAARQFDMSLDALGYLIDRTPDSLWNEKRGGYVFWQQILHAMTGSLFWLRTERTDFAEPYADLKVYPELEKDPENVLTKDQIRELLKQLRETAARFFGRFDSDQLTGPSVLYEKITNLDVLFGQIRHLQYHIGHCESILREAGITDLTWADYYGD